MCMLILLVVADIFIWKQTLFIVVAVVFFSYSNESRVTDSLCCIGARKRKIDGSCSFLTLCSINSIDLIDGELQLSHLKLIGRVCWMSNEFHWRIRLAFV
jgi:hypothetical protein